MPIVKLVFAQSICLAAPSSPAAASLLTPVLVDLSCTHGEELSFLTALDPTAQDQYLGEARKGSALAPAGLLQSSLLCHLEASSEAATPPGWAGSTPEDFFVPFL